MSKIITLLDGTEYRHKDIFKKLYDDEFYYGELGSKALSSSAIKLLVDSPKKYHYVTNYAKLETQGLRDGRLLHMLILEPTKWDQLKFVDVQSKNTKKYREALLEHDIVYTQKEKEDAERLADALLKNDMAQTLLTGSQFEVPAIDYIGEWIFRGKADILTKGKTIIDIKTTTDIKGFKYSAKKYGYDIQCYIYCQLFNVNYFDFKFLVIDKGSCDIAVAECTEEFYLAGKEKTELGIQRYEEWFTSDEVDLDNYYIKLLL